MPPTRQIDCRHRRAGAVSPNGRFALSLDGVSWLLWDVATDRPVRVGSLTGLPHGPVALALPDDGQRLLAGGEDGVVALFDLADGRRVWTATPQRTPVVAVAMPDRNRVVSVGADGTVRTERLPARRWLWGVGRWGAVARWAVGIAVVASVTVGWVPAWALGAVPVLLGLRAARRVRVAFSLSERGVSRGG